MGRKSRRGAGIAASAAALTLVTPLGLQAVAAPGDVALDEGRKTYIVQLAGDPVATYEGGVPGVPRTAPRSGEKVDADSANARKLEVHLRNQQRKALRDAGIAERAKKQEFTVAFNGFTADLTPTQVAHLKKSGEVVNVWEDEIRHADTVTTPEYLGMSGPGGVWATQFGDKAKGRSGKTEPVSSGIANAGKGIVVGVIDTGIDPENPSFAPLANGVGRPAGFACETENDAAFTCTDKIVGARYYGAEFGNNISFDFNSPRDKNGHGSHTAGTAAGNHDVPMTVAGLDMGVGSGMAPAAQVAVYKALWQTQDGQGSGRSSGLVAAINDAVADGVDVINYSVSGSSEYVVTADELAFLAAARVGILVSTSAGNSGPAPSTVAHNAPWTMTVAASTHPRQAQKTVTLGNGETYSGVGIGAGVGPAPLVDSQSIPAAGRTAADALLCLPGSLDASRANGKIVVCTRGTNARVDKGQVVKDAGGVGMILANNASVQSLDADSHVLPAVHVKLSAGVAIKAYAATPGATATISEYSLATVDAPEMAAFSSVGPAIAGGGDLLKPDITGPGVDVVAAYAEAENGDTRFNSLSGTSMSAPHLAGLGALLKQKYPSWSPMAIKSAMMTTARQTTDAGTPILWGEDPATPLNYGAGEVVPAKSYNPGLVYDSNVADWYTYACSINQLQLLVGGAEMCAELPTKDASDLNYPSIAVGELAGSQTITRTVTNVNKSAQQYRAQVEAPAGTTVSVVPDKITVRPGGSATFTVTITRTDAPIGEYTFGSLTWVPVNNQVNAVRSPIAVKPVALAAPGEVPGNGTSGSAELSVIPGFGGTLNTDVDGLLASTVVPVDVTRRPGTTLDALYWFTVPEGTKVTRVATWSEEVPAADIDLNLYNGSTGAHMTGSGNAESTESITLALAPGRYAVAIDLYSEEPQARVPLHVWNLTDTDEGNLTVEPASVEVAPGVPVTLTASWSGLDASKRYLGQVNYLDGTTPAGSTLVSVTP